MLINMINRARMQNFYVMSKIEDQLDSVPEEKFSLL